MYPEIEQVQSLLSRTADGVLREARPERTAREKADGSVITAVDQALQEALETALRERWPAIPLLGEEMSAAEQRRLLEEPGELLWCVDPLDGTTNFAAGVPLYSVSLALLQDGQPRLGAVYDPERAECFYATRGGGAWLNGARLTPPGVHRTLRQALAVVDFKRLPAALAQRLASKSPYRSQRNFGTCALEWCWLAAGRFDVYLHGGMRLWDYAAGHLILTEAGGQACTLNDEPVPVADPGPRSVAASLDADLFHEWKALVVSSDR